MKKRILSFLTSIAMVFSLLLVIPASIQASALEPEYAIKAINELKAKYPHGTIWHADGSDYSGASGTGSQCQGYAFECLDAIFGRAGRGEYSILKYETNYCIGDEVRIPGSPWHSLVIVGIDGDTISFTDCNYIGVNKVRWGTISRSELASKTEYVRRRNGNTLKSLSSDNSPFNTSPNNIGDDFYASIIKTDGWATLAAVNGNIEIASSAADASQIWHFVRQEDNSYVIYNCKSNKVLDVDGAGTTDGTNVQEYPYWGSDAQKWFIYGEWSGEYVLKPKNCNKVLDISSNSSAIGANAQIYTYNGGNAQKFAVYKTEKVGVSTVSVKPGNSNTNTVFSWTKANNASNYNLRISKKSAGTTTSYKDVWSLTTNSYSVTLPEGSYEVYVDSCNCFSYEKSNIVSFSIIKGSTPHTHSYTAKITTQATCTASGIMTYTCKCGDTYTKTIPAKGHTSSDWIIDKQPAVGVKGSKHKECTVCGKVLEKTDIPALSATDISGASVLLSTQKYTYNGKAKTPYATLLFNNKALKKDVDYTVTYSDNIEIGQATVTVTGIGNYKGELKATFAINPARQTISKLTSQYRGFAANWKKDTKVTGYQVQYDVNKNFTSYQSKYVKTNSTYKKTFSGLKSKKTYYVRVRSYKTVNGVKYYGSWSAVKSVKTK